jgi:protein deglycase
MATVLVILAPGFEEIEAITPIDLLRRAGAEVTVATIAEGIHVTGRDGITIHADTPLAPVEAQDFDCVFLPGGPGVQHLRADPRVGKIVRRHHEAGRWVVAICAAPTVLHDLGILAGRRFTAHPSVQAELPNLIPTERVVVDGNIITSRGAGTALDFGLMLIEKVISPEKRAEVSGAICA